MHANDKIKKVLFFGSSRGIGLTYHLAVASKYFSKLEGIDFTLISGNREQFPGLFDIVKQSNVKHITIEGIDEKNNFFKRIGEFLKLVKTNHYDIIHCQTNTHLLYAIVSHIFFGSKVIYSVNSYNNGSNKFVIFITSLIMSIVFKLFKVNVITLSSSTKKHFEKYLVKSSLIPLGFEPKIKERSYDFINFNIIYVAKFHPHKRHAWLISALKEIMREYKDINLILPGDGKELNFCKNLAKKYGIYDRVIFPGWIGREQLYNLYLKSHVAIVISKSETFGHTIVEPMFFGLPVISTPVGIAVDIIKDGINGFIVSYGDLNKIAEKVIWFYHNREKIKELGQNALKSSLEMLSWEKIANLYRNYVINL